MCIITGKLKATLPFQRLADRWSAQEAYGQVSVFFTDSAGLDLEGVDSTISLFGKKLEESAALSSESGEALSWTYGYSSESTLPVKREAITVESAAMGIGEDFFKFHPLRLVSGSYIYDSDLMQDRIVIDSNLAWQLFGATNVAGMGIEIGGLPYIIAGVVAPEEDFASTTAYGDKPRVYMFYEMLLLNDDSAKITCLELLTPNSVEGFTAGTLKTVLKEQEVSENDRDIIDNSGRYSFTNLFGVMAEFGLRSMRPALAPSYPYWENAARMVEDYLAVILTIMILLLIYPAVSLIFLIVRIWKGRKWRISYNLCK